MKINENDLKAIQQIEKKLGVKLKKIDKIEWDSRSYILNENGQVTGLSLSDCDLKDLNHISLLLQDLSQLTVLNLWNNQISDLTPLKDLKLLTILSL